MTEDRRFSGARRSEKHEHRSRRQLSVEPRVNREPAGKPVRDRDVQCRGFSHTDRCIE